MENSIRTIMQNLLDEDQRRETIRSDLRAISNNQPAAKTFDAMTAVEETDISQV